MATRRYYAAQKPRGFANEIEVCSFGSRALRDAWVDAHADDGDVNSAACGAYAVTAAEARKICRYHGDAVTGSYNSTKPIVMDAYCSLDAEGNLVE